MCGGGGLRPADRAAREAPAAAWLAPRSRRRSPGPAGLLRFPSPPLEAPSGRRGAGGCGGAGRRRGECGERACPRGGGVGAAGGGEPAGAGDRSLSPGAPPGCAQSCGDVGPNPG